MEILLMLITCLVLIVMAIIISKRITGTRATDSTFLLKPDYFYEDIIYKDGAAFRAYFLSSGEMVEGTEEFLYVVPD